MVVGQRDIRLATGLRLVEDAHAVMTPVQLGGVVLDAAACERPNDAPLGLEYRAGRADLVLATTDRSDRDRARAGLANAGLNVDLLVLEFADLALKPLDFLGVSLGLRLDNLALQALDALVDRGDLRPGLVLDVDRRRDLIGDALQPVDEILHALAGLDQPGSEVLHVLVAEELAQRLDGVGERHLHGDETVDRELDSGEQDVIPDPAEDVPEGREYALVLLDPLRHLLERRH